MTAKELAEKIAALGKQVGVELNGPVFYSQLESLLSAALEEHLKTHWASQVKQWLAEAKAAAYHEGVLTTQKELAEWTQTKIKEAYLDAAKIAEPWPCYHNQGACGPSIANAIRVKAGEVGCETPKS